MSLHYRMCDRVSTIKDVITYLYRAYDDLFKEVIMIGAPFWEPERISNEVNQLCYDPVP